MRRMISERGNRNLRGESGLTFPAKSPRVSSDVALKDRGCIFPCKDNKVSSSPTEKKHKHGKKKSVSASCQTNIDQPEKEELVRNVARLKINWKQSSSKQSHFGCVFAKLQLFRPFPFLSIHSFWNKCLSPLGSSVVLVILTNEELSLFTIFTSIPLSLVLML